MNNTNQKRKIYCCNCGKLGHVLKNCLEPTISLGVILYHLDQNTDEIKFLMIRRKFSLGFMDFILGKYSLNNIDYIMRIVNVMTIKEKVRIMNEPFESLWYSIDYNKIDSEDSSIPDDMKKKIEIEFQTSKKKFYLLRHGYLNKNNTYINLEQIIYNSKHHWIEQEWEFPKGKRKMNESNLDTAIREFKEETNYPENDMDVILCGTPIIEKYFGSNGKRYKHIYYIAKANQFCDYANETFTNNQFFEISHIQWLSYREALSIIRPYQIEKKLVLNQTLKIIAQYEKINI